MFQRMRSGISQYAKEITLTLIVKLILIFGIWFFFFSQPIDDSLSSDKVRQQILGSSELQQPTSVFQSIKTSQGDHSW